MCEDVCSTSCETVCGTVEEPCNCGFVTYEVCEDECQLWSEQCEWVTRVYTSYPDLSEVVATEASVWLQGESEPLSGQPRQAERALDCSQSP